MEIFDGTQLALDHEQQLAAQVAVLQQQGKPITIAALLFVEDAGSQLYTRLKREAALRVGIGYQIFTFSILDPIEVVQGQIEALNSDPAITGIIVQKPAKKRVIEVMEGNVLTRQPLEAYALEWWQSLVTTLDPAKDVDGLHPETLAAVKAGTWKAQAKVLPATAKAVLTILDSIFSPDELLQQQIAILGKSDILGKPLLYELQNLGCQVEMMGSAELSERVTTGQALKDKTVVISATGRKHLVTGELLSQGVALIDVGEPKPDVDLASVQDLAWFVTPVPGGVGPLTVVSLLENSVELAQRSID